MWVYININNSLFKRRNLLRLIEFRDYFLLIKNWGVVNHWMLGRKGYTQGVYVYVCLTEGVGLFGSVGFAFKLQCATNHRRVYMFGAVLGGCALYNLDKNSAKNLPILFTSFQLPPAAVSPKFSYMFFFPLLCPLKIEFFFLQIPPQKNTRNIFFPIKEIFLINEYL